MTSYLYLLNVIIFLGRRYSTSKCSSLLDFHNKILTYGFRGEALASICCLSKSVKLSSSVPNNPSIKYYKNISNFGQIHSQVDLDFQSKHYGHGTSIYIEGLFQKDDIKANCSVLISKFEDIRAMLQKIALINYTVKFDFKEASTSSFVRYEPSTTLFERLFKYLLNFILIGLSCIGNFKFLIILKKYLQVKNCISIKIKKIEVIRPFNTGWPKNLEKPGI